MDIDFKALSDSVNPQFRINAGKLAHIMKNLTYKQHNQSEWARPGEHDGHPCGTPQCALGWGISSNLTPGVSIAIGAYVRADDDLVDNVLNRLLKKYPSARKMCEDGSPLLRIDTMSREDYLLYEDAQGEDHDNNRYALAVRDDTGEVLGWSTVGNEFFGAAVMEVVFTNGDLTTGDVVQYLLQYEDRGYVRDEYDKTHFIAPRDQYESLRRKLDGWVERATDGPAPHVCIGYYHEQD